MAWTSLGPLNFFLDIGASRHWELIIALGQGAKGNNSGIPFQSFIKYWYVECTHYSRIDEAIHSSSTVLRFRFIYFESWGLQVHDCSWFMINLICSSVVRRRAEKDGLHEYLHIIWCATHEKSLMKFADNAGPNQPARMHRLIWAFVVRSQN